MGIIGMVILKLLDPDQKLRLWAKVLPWLFMLCLLLISIAYAWSLVR